jgi:fructose/tagatose bisphosphate aldolase
LSPRNSVEHEIARDRIRDAARLLRDITGKEEDATLEKYSDYMISPEYESFRRDFLAAVRFGEPAWAMIDTGSLPLILNFATSRDLTEAVRRDLNNREVMLEAEISATGQSGENSVHKYWSSLSGQEREREKAKVLAFIGYTNADAIAYEIGMDHAAKKGEVHEPDGDKLTDIQSAIFKRFRRNVPFAQHGGTGSSRIIKGLVGKYNVNTQYLFSGMMAELKRVDGWREKILARDKKAIGTDRFLEEIAAVKAACIGYLKETGTYGSSPLFRDILGTPKQNLPLYQGLEVKATE